MNGVRGCNKAPVRRKWVQSAALWSDDLAIAEWWAVAVPLINLLKTGISVTSGDSRLELSCSVAVQAEFNDGTLSMIGSAICQQLSDVRHWRPTLKHHFHTAARTPVFVRSVQVAVVDVMPHSTNRRQSLHASYHAPDWVLCGWRSRRSPFCNWRACLESAPDCR